MPPSGKLLSPTGQTVYTNITSTFPPAVPGAEPNAALLEHACKTVGSYLAQIGHIEELAAKSAASRRAYLFAPLSGETK